MRRTAIVILCLFILSVGVGLKAQNIRLHYDFGRFSYDKDLKGHPVLTPTVEKFHPDKWGSTYFFVDMDYISDGMAAAYWEIVCESKFWKNSFSVHAEYNGGLIKGFSYNNAYLSGATYIYNNTSSPRGFSLLVLYKYIQRHCPPHNFRLTGTRYTNFSRNLLTFSGFADWRREEMAYDKTIFLIESQFRANLNRIKGISDKFNLSVGSEAELSNNSGGRDGFYVIPTLVLGWTIN